MSQKELMKFDPATGEEKPYPSHAEQWREWHGKNTAWLFNPWTGARREAGDVGGDVFGFLIRPPTGKLGDKLNTPSGRRNMDDCGAPYPGMATAFEAHAGQSWTDHDFRNETAVWAAAWKAALRSTGGPT